jgi:tetratricopeptide (TPR) repeat protein
MKQFSSIVLALVFPAMVFCQTTSQEWYDKGSKLKTEKKVVDALDAFRKATELQNDYKEAWYETGWCLNDLKKYDAALTSLRTSRALGYDYARLFFELGYAFEKLNYNDSAIDQYNRVLAMNNTYSSAYKQLGYVYYNKSEYEKALEHFVKYESVYKNPVTDYLYWYRKGFMENALKKYAEAKVSLTKSLESKTDYINTYLELGFASKNLKLDDDAIGYYEKAMEIDPKSHVPLNGIGEVYRDNKKDMNEAVNWYNKTLALNPNERKANFGLGYCNNTLGNYAIAVTYLQKAIQYESTYTAAYVELGYSNYMLKNTAAALENFNKALSLNPKNENARYYSGLVYVNQHDKIMAQKMVDELKELNSKNAAALQERVNKL